MSVLICGSLAYDTAMAFNEKFRLHECSAEKSPQTLYFMVPDLRRSHGGCAGNIAYNLSLLGKNALPMGTVGNDFAPYAEWLDSCGIARDYIMQIEHTFTAQMFVTQDMDDSKIIAFHPGAMNFSHYNQVPLNKNISLGVIAPDGYEGMRIHTQQFIEAGIPIIFYPHIRVSELDGDDLLEFIEQAAWIVINKEEWPEMQRLTGLTAEQIAARVQAVIVNQGAEGAFIYAGDICYQTAGLTPRPINDLSGSDDAFCAGLLYGLLNDIDWETTGGIATLMWAITAEHHGTQTHTFSLEKFKSLFEKVFGYALIA
ncbi:MAG: carbohydrate kinase family protein [Gammaproteobacteria bacterium]|nr:carbohydrate kinase family protein [Gammaproteobacteria bacterium]